MNKKHCLLTNDVEEHSIWFNCLRYQTGEKVLKEGMPILLDIYEKYNIKSTFYFTGTMAENFPEVVKMVVPYGHEVASHGYSHDVNQAFDVLPFETQVAHLRRSKELLEDLSGQEVISFRAPALRVNKFTSLALTETNFRTDSSVASQRFDMFLSFGGTQKINWLTTPRLPYRTKEDNLFKKGTGSIVEIPLSALFVPYVGTTMRLFPSITKFQRMILDFESFINNKPIVFDIHPNEFINEKTEDRIIHRRTKNLFSYLVADLLRAKLKVKNLGKNAIPLYMDEIGYYHNKNYEFCTVQDYYYKSNLMN